MQWREEETSTQGQQSCLSCRMLRDRRLTQVLLKGQASKPSHRFRQEANKNVLQHLQPWNLKGLVFVSLL